MKIEIGTVEWALIAQDGLPHPRNLDSAIDAIIEAISQI